MIAIFVYGLNLQKQTSFQQKKLEQIAQGKLPRSLLINAAKSHLADRNRLLNLTGEGTTSFMWGVAQYFPGVTD